MEQEQIVLSFISLFSLIAFFISFLVQKVFSSNSHILLDKDFSKPQAFHTVPVPRSGGLGAIIALSIFLISYNFLFQTLFVEYLTISIFLFLLGFLDDIKINLSPNVRLLLMIIFLSFSIIFFSINIERVDLIFLNSWLSNGIFNYIFILLCFLFIINGANLIDGFNGLLCIHVLIINIILLNLNTQNGFNDLSYLILSQIVILFSFLLFNFPKAKMFLGDGGSYLFGSLTVINIIETNNQNSEISSFFFCSLLFYLFFEVFFSFLRKAYLKKSPLKPDSYHLHMLSYKYLVSLSRFRDCNYLNSIIINFVFIISIIPAIYFKDNGIFCRYWFFIQLLLYIILYIRLYSFVKK